MINFREIQLLSTMLRLGSVSETARTLRISQPAVSQTLTAIQLELGIPLFDRVKGRLRPTSHALRLLPELERLVGNIFAFHDLTLTLREGNAGYLSISTAPSIASGFLAVAIVRFRRRHPDVYVSVHAGGGRDTVDRVARGEAEIGIAPPMEGDVQVHSSALCEGRVICVMPAGHRLAALSVVKPSDLADEDLISFGAASVTGRRIIETFQLAGVRYPIAVDINQGAAVGSLVSQGGGVALIDSFVAVDRFFPELIQRPFQPEIRLPMQILTPRSRPLSKLAAQFCAVLKEVAGSPTDIVAG